VVDPQRELTWLRRLRECSHLLAAEWDPEKLFPLVLDAAVELTEAERGYLVRVLGKRPSGGYRYRIEAARGFEGSTLQPSKGSVSRTVIKRVVDSGEGIVTEAEDDLLGISSVERRRVLSLACVPLKLRGEILGVLYLDNRWNRGAFTPPDLPLLNTFAEQAALAIDTAERLAREQARRAELDATHQRLRQAEAALGALEQAPSGALHPVRDRFAGLVGSSLAMQGLYEEIETAARAQEVVLVLGESGAGKEQVARAIHQLASPDAPWVVQGCAGLSAEQIHTELLGRAEGGGYQGSLSQAAGGLLLLDEVCELPAAAQARLLRILQDRTYRPVGSDRSLPLECRVVATSSKDLRAGVEAGAFRADLFYRLDVLRLVVPPLRERAGDVPLLIEHVAAAQGRRLSLSPKARELLVSYAWPGNVRQLENEVRRLVAAGQLQVAPQHLSPEIVEGRGVSAPVSVGGRTLGEMEKGMVAAALEACKGNKARTARQLGIPRSTLYNLLARYELL
jgi:transcriptional regulator with GAF, ATPase, and Fis domain